MDDIKISGPRCEVHASSRENRLLESVVLSYQSRVGALDAVCAAKREKSLFITQRRFIRCVQLMLTAGVTLFSDAASTATAGVLVEEPSAPAVSSAPSLFTTLYSAWDIGAVSTHGSTLNDSTGMFTVTGGGNDIAGLNDSVHFACVPVSGDFEMIARVTSFPISNSGAKAGVMIRENSASDAAEASIVVTPLGSVIFLRRTSTATPTWATTVQSVFLPVLLRLRRENNTVSAYYSSNGASWASMGSAELDSVSSGLAGLAVTSKANSGSSSARFDGVNLITGISKTPLDGLTLYDVGSAKIAGSAGLNTSNGVISVTGSGYYFPNASKEGCAYLARRSSASLAASTHIMAARTGVSPARAGLMMRDSVSEDSAQVTLGINNAGNVIFEHRTSVGAPLITRSCAPLGRYIILDRRDSTFTAMVSEDGANYIIIGTATVYLRNDALVGLITTSAELNTAVTADFDAFELLP